MQIWFHGTNKTASEQILKDGFKAGTWLARHLEDSLAFGGPYIFEVAVNETLIGADVTWQMHTLEVIPPEAIVSLTRFNQKLLKDNPALRLEIFQSNSDGSVDGFAGKVEGHRW
jgi:hypothetical protein